MASNGERNNMRNNADKIRGALYGVAIGDALGGALEFMSTDEINKQYGGVVTEMIGGGWLNLVPGETTDDTAMTLAVCEGIIENQTAPVEAIGRRFIAWVDTQPKDIGMTCARAIHIARENLSEGMSPGSAWAEAAQAVARENGHLSGGNGALMRTIGTALAYDDEEARARYTVQIAEMTHYDDISSDICARYTNAVAQFIKGDRARGQRALEAMAANYGFTDRPIPSGWVKDSMECAYASFVKEPGFEKTLITAVNMGGDADTIGAITGGLAGAYYGFDAIPRRWIETLSTGIRTRIDAFATWCLTAL